LRNPFWQYSRAKIACEDVLVAAFREHTSLWVLTHTDDFARAFVPLLGDVRAIGEPFHITSDSVLTWRQVVDADIDAAFERLVLAHR